MLTGTTNSYYPQKDSLLILKNFIEGYCARYFLLIEYTPECTVLFGRSEKRWECCGLQLPCPPRIAAREWSSQSFLPVNCRPGRFPPAATGNPLSVIFENLFLIAFFWHSTEKICRWTAQTLETTFCTSAHISLSGKFQGGLRKSLYILLLPAKHPVLFPESYQPLHAISRILFPKTIMVQSPMGKARKITLMYKAGNLWGQKTSGKCHMQTEMKNVRDV